MASTPTYLVVGASLAGAKAAERLRKGGFDGRIVLIGAEKERPYERPPLSKGYLLGTEAEDKAYVHEAGWYDEHEVELRLGTRVVGLDLGAHEVETADGDRVEYAKLLLATGSMPRKLNVPGTDLDGVHYLRTMRNSRRLGEAFQAGGRVVVLGAGWIGLETAAAARSHGCAVTVVEPQETPLLAALGREVGGFFADLHRAHGVDLLPGRGVRGIRGEGAVTGVELDDGTLLPADTVVIGVGVVPNDRLAERAGLRVDDGILVDAQLRTTDADVFAVGDVARDYVPRYDTAIRVEHWANALRGGTTVGRTMLGEDVVYDRLPHFFSDQYDAGMEFSGWLPPEGYDRLVVRGELGTDGFQVFWVRDGKLVAGMHVNQWDDGIKPIETLLKADGPVDLAALADPDTPLDQLTPT